MSNTTEHPAYSFCEPVTATSIGVEHIRVVGPEGVKPGGGVPNDALCGFPLRFGWDLPGLPVDDATVRRLGTPRPGDGRVFLCSHCAEVWRSAR